jgi:proteasome accessory factor A
MRERVFGVETEYALIYHPGRGEERRPSNLSLYPRFEAALRRRVRSLPHAFSPLRAKGGRFLENGGTFHYEATPEDYENGLLELASPECRDPFALLCHERAKDELIEELAAEVNAELRLAGWRGEVRIGKNNVDSQGNTFGSHESYWIDDHLPLALRAAFLPLWLALWALSLPVLAWVIGAQLLVVLGVVLGGIGILAAAAVLGIVRPRAARALLGWVEARATRLQTRPGGLARGVNRMIAPLYPLLRLHSAVYNRFHYRAFRRELTAFLVTRIAWCGAGAVAFDRPSLFRVAQRPPFLKSLSRIFPLGDDRPIYEIRDLFFLPWSALRRRRRLHLMVGDANLCEWAQALRFGATALVLEAIESRAAGPLPRLADPLASMAEINADAELVARVELDDGSRASALEIQRRYLAAVRSLLAREAEPLPLWKARVLAMWEETLALLEREPAALADRVDWIAKRALLHEEVPDARDRAALAARGARVLRDDGAATAADRRLREMAFRVWRTDLRYHELSPRGGYRRLERRGLVRRLSDPARVARARTEPPDDTRACARGRAIRFAHLHARSGAAAWHRVRLGKFDWRFFVDPLDPGPGDRRGDGL